MKKTDAEIISEYRKNEKRINLNTRRENFNKNRLCLCGHKFSEHSPYANCNHEIGGVCMRHSCAGRCLGKFGKCKCEQFTDKKNQKARVYIH